MNGYEKLRAEIDMLSAEKRNLCTRLGLQEQEIKGLRAEAVASAIPTSEASPTACPAYAGCSEPDGLGCEGCQQQDNPGGAA